MAALKLVITSKSKLKLKYGNKFSELEKLFSKWIKADKGKMLTTSIIYIDDAASASKFGIKPVAIVDEENCKNIFDTLYQKHQPAYMVIFGAQDVIPFQQLVNELYDPNNDSDKTVPSDLPYACETPYSKMISSFTDPTRVVGRIPDVPGKGNLEYVKVIIADNIRHESIDKAAYLDYFAVTAFVWKKSTQQSINNIFGNYKKLLECPPAKGGYTKAQLSPLTHFYNCHGALADPNYFGQKGKSFPVALNTADLNGKISYGTIVAAECCYGNQLLDPEESGFSIANNYLANHALVMMGSSTIAYGPSSGQSLADLICQYFIQNVHNGASAGRALLEARQKYLTNSGPDLDAYELKTLAQFYILGDPSITPVITEVKKDAMSTIENRRMNLFNKGISLGQTVSPSKKVNTSKSSKFQKELNVVLKQNGFEKAGKQIVFETSDKNKKSGAKSKAFLGGISRFRTFQKTGPGHDGISNIQVLVVKENDNQMLGYKVYVSR